MASTDSRHLVPIAAVAQALRLRRGAETPQLAGDTAWLDGEARRRVREVLSVEG